MDTVTALALLIQNLTRLAEFGGSLARAHAEGRTLTPEEVNAFVAADDAARAKLQAAIDAAGG